MNLTAWLDPVTGFPPARPYREFVPEAGTPRPCFKNVVIAGTLSADAGPASIQLAAIVISAPGGQLKHLLRGCELSIDYGPPLVLGHLLKGDRVSLLTNVSGHMAPHLRGTSWGAKANARGVFWMSVPAP